MHFVHFFVAEFLNLNLPHLLEELLGIMYLRFCQLSIHCNFLFVCFHRKSPQNPLSSLSRHLSYALVWHLIAGYARVYRSILFPRLVEH